MRPSAGSWSCLPGAYYSCRCGRAAHCARRCLRRGSNFGSASKAGSANSARVLPVGYCMSAEGFRVAHSSLSTSALRKASASSSWESSGRSSSGASCPYFPYPCPSSPCSCSCPCPYSCWSWACRPKGSGTWPSAGAHGWWLRRLGGMGTELTVCVGRRAAAGCCLGNCCNCFTWAIFAICDSWFVICDL